MAYAYKCSGDKKIEKTLNYNFNLLTLNGCLGFTMSFLKFKSYCKKRNGFDPNPCKTIIDPEEKQTIKEENKIRQEQGIPKRKEKPCMWTRKLNINCVLLCRQLKASLA